METKAIKTEGDPRDADELFEQAAYFDACARDEFSSEDPIEDPIDALRERFEQVWQAGDTHADTLKRAAPIEVLAYERDTVGAEWIKDSAERLLEDTLERFEWDFGSPDGDSTDFGTADAERVRKGLESAIADLVGSCHVWRCSRVASRVYHEDEIARELELEVGQ